MRVCVSGVLAGSRGRKTSQATKKKPRTHAKQIGFDISVDVWHRQTIPVKITPTLYASLNFWVEYNCNAQNPSYLTTFVVHWGWTPYLVTQDIRRRLVPEGPQAESRTPLSSSGDRWRPATCGGSENVSSEVKDEGARSWQRSSSASNGTHELINVVHLTTTSFPLDTCPTKSGCVCFFVNLSKIF